MEENIEDFTENMEKKVSQLKEMITKISKLVEEERLGRETLFELKQKEIMALD